MPRAVSKITVTIPKALIQTLDEVVQQMNATRSQLVKEAIEQYLLKNQMTRETSIPPEEQKGWEVFRRLGQDAIGGQLPDASTKHDQYLYGNQT